mgnify:FL=1
MRFVYAPLFFFGFIGTAVLIADQGAGLGWLQALLLVAIAVSVLCEWRWPYRPRWNRNRRDRRRDVIHASVNESLNILSIAAIPLIASWLPDLGIWPADWPLGLQLLLAIPVADLGTTLVHYASHRSALLWRLHAVHHSVTRMYGFNGLMKHPLHQLLEALGGTLPLLLCGLPQEVTALLAFSISIQLLLQHSNIDMRLGMLRHVFAWAPLHRLHHLKYGRHGDVNFALFLPLWDRMLGTALYLPDYELADDDLGIGDCPDYPVDYSAQLLQPLHGAQGTHPPAVVPAGLRDALAEYAKV